MQPGQEVNDEECDFLAFLLLNKLETFMKIMIDAIILIDALFMAM